MKLLLYRLKELKTVTLSPLETSGHSFWLWFMQHLTQVLIPDLPVTTQLVLSVHHEYPACKHGLAVSL